jgi:hypothetical protein
MTLHQSENGPTTNKDKDITMKDKLSDGGGSF